MYINQFAKRVLTRRLLSMALIAAFVLPGLSQSFPSASANTAAIRSTTAEVSADPDEEIVYIDQNGAIRVLDTLQSSGSPAVDWVSPTTGWSNFALGDVNNDGDQEIVAIRSTGSGIGEVTVFDPVVTSGAFDGETPNGIPWATLYTAQIDGNPKLVATGKLDPNLPGDHIFYTYDFNGGSRVVVLKPAIQDPNGREWAVHYTRDFDERWEQVSIGNVDKDGADEIALIDDSVGRLSVYRSDANSEPIMKKTGDSRPWRATTIAEYDQGSTIEVIGIRNAPASLSSFFVFKWNRDKEEFDEKDPESFAPSPRFVFGADLNNDGKEAIVMLRSVSDANTVRMIVRGDDGDEVPNELEQFLDEDNGYLTGEGGDVDGDGKDEIVIMRDNNIRIYTSPDRNASRDDYPLQTDSDRIHIGDLDRNGFSIGPVLSTTISSIEETLQIGATGITKSFELRNETTSLPITFEANAENSPSWLSVTPRFGNTPAVISYRANAIGLAPGEYTTRIIITSDNATVVNQPFIIQVKLTVTPASIETNSDAVNFTYLSSSNPMTLTQQVQITGAPGVQFTVGIQGYPQFQSAVAAVNAASLSSDTMHDDGMGDDGMGRDVISGYVDDNGNIVAIGAEGTEFVLAKAGISEVPWLTASPTAGSVPTIVTLSVNTSLQTDAFDSAYLVIIGDSRTGEPPQNVRLVRVSLLRATDRVFLPLGQR